MPGRRAAERIRKAIAVVNSVADDAGDEEITPTEIAEAIRDCLELSEVDDAPNVRKSSARRWMPCRTGCPRTSWR